MAPPSPSIAPPSPNSIASKPSTAPITKGEVQKMQTRDLMERTQDLPRELFDQIHHHLVAQDPPNQMVVIDRAYRFPIQAHIDSRTRATFLRGYFRYSLFACRDAALLERWLLAVPEHWHYTIQRIEYWPHNPPLDYNRRSLEAWYEMLARLQTSPIEGRVFDFDPQPSDQDPDFDPQPSDQDPDGKTLRALKRKAQRDLNSLVRDTRQLVTRPAFGGLLHRFCFTMVFIGNYAPGFFCPSNFALPDTRIYPFRIPY